MLGYSTSSNASTQETNCSPHDTSDLVKTMPSECAVRPLVHTPESISTTSKTEAHMHTSQITQIQRKRKTIPQTLRYEGRTTLEGTRFTIRFQTGPPESATIYGGRSPKTPCTLRKKEPNVTAFERKWQWKTISGANLFPGSSRHTHGDLKRRAFFHIDFGGRRKKTIRREFEKI